MAVRAAGVPVHHALAPVDVALAVKIHEHPLHGGGVVVVQREPLARPVAGTTQLLELFDDDVAVLLLPLPGAAQERVAPEVMARFLFLFPQGLFHDVLRGQTGVVRARQPEHLVPGLARPPGENVLDGVVEDVAEGQHAGDVRRRDDDGKRRVPGGHASGIGGEAACLLPARLPFGLHGGRFVGFGDFRDWVHEWKGVRVRCGKGDGPTQRPARAAGVMYIGLAAHRRQPTKLASGPA